MTPNTTVTLYATPFDISNKYVIAANSPGEALAIVSSYPSKVYTDCYWQRDNDFVFRANGNINEVEQYNYCVYLNNGRYNFAFITECDYVNDAMTLVHLAIDPWLNFAGQYVFHDSPMVRCHPSSADYSKVNYHTEPYTVEAWRTVHEDYGEPHENMSSNVFFMSVLNGNQYDDTTLQVWLQGMYELLNGGGAATLQGFYQGMTARGCDIYGGHAQAPTMYLSRNGLDTYVKRIMQNGRQNDIIGAYFIPPVFVPEGISPDSGSIIFMRPKTHDITLSIEPPEAIHWKKIRYSEQFNRLYVNMCGTVSYLPFNNLKVDISTVTLHLLADPSYNGCIYASVDPDDMYNADAYMLHSMPWDKVQVSGYGLNTTALVQSGLNIAPTLFDTLSSVAGAAMSIPTDVAIGGLIGGVGGAITAGAKGVLGTAGELARGVANIAPELMRQGDIIRSGGYAGNTGVSSMASYNMRFPLVTFALERPYDISNLERLFGTYGYMQDGDICKIRFKELPHWHYYQAANASIEGNKVPQRYLAQVIGMFNSGVFVFNSVADYKDFSKALDNHY